MRSLKIALTADPEIPVPPVHYGGIERVVDMLARNLALRGHDVTLFAHPSSQCPVSRVGWSGANSLSPTDTIRNALALAREVARRGFDLVHSFSRLAYLAPILPFSIPKLMSYQRQISPATTRLAHRLSRGTLRFSAISRKMMRDVANVGEWRMIPNGVPVEDYEFRAVVAPDAPLVFLGRVEEIKGPHLAIEAAARAGRQLIIAGNVPDAHRGWFDAHVAPKIDGRMVRYVGPVDDAEKSELLGNAIALLMPVLWEEPFGIVMAEAMACGAPVIGFRRGAVPEVVENGVTGFVVDDLDEMVDAILRVGALDRAACRARVERLYSGDAVTQGYLGLYEDMMSLKRRHANR